MTMAMHLGTILDEAQPGWLHLRIVALSLAIMVLEGIDIQIIGFAAPTIILELGIAPPAFGVVFSAGLLGALIGAAVLGPLGDRIGRKPIIICSVLVFAIGTVATPIAGSVGGFVAIRLVASLGLGGVIPNVLALVAEYAPTRHRAAIVAIVATGQLLGGMVGGVVSGWAIPFAGWEPVFIGAGLISVAFVPLVWFGLPESLRFLSQSGRHNLRIHTQLQKLCGTTYDLPAGNQFPSEGVQPPITALLIHPFRTTTLLLWITISANLFMTTFVIYWLPTLLDRMGMPLGTAILAVSVMNGGGIAGGLLLSLVLARFQPVLVLFVTYLLASCAVAAIGVVAPDVTGVMVASSLAGFLGLGAYSGVSVIAATHYPTGLRSAAIGWAIALGKLGSISGPMAASAGLAGGVPIRIVFLISASGGVVAAAALLMLHQHRRLGVE